MPLVDAMRVSQPNLLTLHLTRARQRLGLGFHLLAGVRREGVWGSRWCWWQLVVEEELIVERQSRPTDGAGRRGRTREQLYCIRHEMIIEESKRLKKRRSRRYEGSQR